MQTNNNEHGKRYKDEDGVNFRPSPNFKHMKKYLKSKFEESEGSSGSGGAERESRTVEGRERGARGAVQPPLPPHPPPPESPPAAALKTEREDDGYERVEARPEPAERVMCRQFVRGACTRGDACIYAHEIIPEQLHGVYTFCKNFQNSAGCKLPKCKFVHATVFEKEHFYRTGYMPPHAFAHIKDAAPPSNRDGTAPADSRGAVAGPPAPALGVAAVAAAAADPLRELHDPMPRDAALADDEPPKCSECHINELRLQVLKQKVEGVLRFNEDTRKKAAHLALKTNKLNAVIAALMTSPSAGPAAPPPPAPLINVRNEKEINGLVDQLKLRLPSAPPPDVPPALVRLLLKGRSPPDDRAGAH